MKNKKLTDAEMFIIGSALAEIHKEKDIEIVREKVLGTVVGINKNAMETFDLLVSKKKKAGLIK